VVVGKLELVEWEPYKLARVVHVELVAVLVAALIAELVVVVVMVLVVVMVVEMVVEYTPHFVVGSVRVVVHIE